MILGGVEASEYLHIVDDVPLFLGLFAFLLLRALEVEEAAFQHELLAANALIDARIVQLNHIILQLDVLLCVVLEVLKIGEKGVSVHIVFLIEISSLGHISNNLTEVGDG